MREQTERMLFELGMPGPLRDRLVGAVLAGEKVATSSLLLQHEDEGEALPQPGERRLMVDSSSVAVAVVEVLDVYIIRLGDADLQLALDEGEGFRSVEEWRDAHEAFWRECVRPSLRNPEKWSLDDDAEVVVERFRVLDGPLWGALSEDLQQLVGHRAARQRRSSVLRHAGAALNGGRVRTSRRRGRRRAALTRSAVPRPTNIQIPSPAGLLAHTSIQLSSLR